MHPAINHFALLEILAIGFTLAFMLGFVTHRLRLSPIVGYLLAGYLVGPHSPGFVADAQIVSQLAEVGVILLMFGVGLHFNLKGLLAVKRIAIPGALGQSLVATALGTWIAMTFGLTLGAGLVLGLGLAVASTVVLMRVLMDGKILDTPQGHAAVGWLIVEDILTVLVLVLLPALAGSVGQAGKGGAMGVLTTFGWAVIKMALLWVLVLPVGGKIIPWLLAQVARSRSRELFTLAILVLAFVIATGSAWIFDASMALGAFLAGMVVGQTKVSHQATADILPLRDAFAVLFFVSVGMLFDPGFVLMHAGLVLACLGVVLLAKPLAAFILVGVLGYSVRTALTVALGLAQIGEFSFILAQQAQSLKMLPEEGASVLVACALISITLNPLLFRTVVPIENWLRGRKSIWRLLNRRTEQQGRAANRQTQLALDRPDQAPQAIVVGYGPVGQRVARILWDFDQSPIVIDLNVDTVSNLVAAGRAAVYGDASHEAILKIAGIDKATYLLITLPDLTGAMAVVTSARRLNPEIKILVRARYLGASDILAGMGVTAISFEEEEVAKAMARALLDEVAPKPKD